MQNQVKILKECSDGHLCMLLIQNGSFRNLLVGGWKLFGKTGWSLPIRKFDGKNEIGWFIGWIENGDDFFPFAYNIREDKIKLSQRIPRVKQLLMESNINKFYSGKPGSLASCLSNLCRDGFGDCNGVGFF